MEVLEIIKKNIERSEYYNNHIYRNASTIEELPILTKGEVQTNYNRIFNHQPGIMYTETSGSTGTPMQIPWNQNEYISSLTTLWRLRNRHGIQSTDFYLTCHAGYYYKTNRIQESVIVTKNSISLSKLWYTEDMMQLYLNHIKLFAPKWIFAQPSFVYYLGQYIKKREPQIANMIQYIELVGELLSPEIKKAICAFFPNADIVNMYGMQEFNGIMYENDGKMQEISSNVYVEILDDQGNTCNYGEEGNIVVTGLINTAFPLVRYKTGDRGIKNGENSYSITSGRSNDIFVHNGKHYDGSIFFVVINDYNKTHQSKISKFQVEYDGEKLIFRIFSFNNLPDEITIKNDLQEILRSIDEIQIEVDVRIQHGEHFIFNSNKTKYFISNSQHGNI